MDPRLREDDGFIWFDVANSQTVASRPSIIAGIADLGDDIAMTFLNVILLSIMLIVCNLVYCGQHIVADVHHSRHAQVVWGAVAFAGAMIALIAMIWATLASLANF